MKNLLLAAFWCSCAALFAQNPNPAQQTPAARRAGEVLVQLEPGFPLENLALGGDFWLKKTVAADWHVFLFGFDETTLDATTALAKFSRMPGVRAAQWNHEAAPRTTEPNDPSWGSQKDMTLIGMPTAWDGTTGGVMYTRDSLRGDTIVVAVLEQGFLITHPDLVPNLWHNWGEIPDNGIDDDGNGYRDDYTGWDPATNSSGAGLGGSHGTSVCGIVGARGDNSLGVSGVNWNVQMMVMTNSAKIEDQIIAAYYYVAKMRRRYNESDGQEGAFVVATNASFGIDFGKPAQHPLWCAVYDSLGRVGVLNAGATANMNADVDQVGDIPSTCPSDYLIGVTNVNANSDTKSGAGYGAVSIDLGAPGDASFTTSLGNNGGPGYASFSGTSGATPHVSGAIALLYSLDCPNLTGDALDNPAACALRFKDLILNSVAPNASLEGITTTGGRLDVAAAVDAVRELCGGSSGPLAILSINPNPTREALEIRYETPNFGAYNLRIFNMLGQLLFQDEIRPDQFGEKTYRWEDAAQLPAGVYAVVISQEKTRVARKFVKI